MMRSDVLALWSRYILLVKRLISNLVTNQMASNARLNGTPRIDIETAKRRGL